jgi:NAD/NADP transhydrogenase alpha subunit
MTSPADIILICGVGAIGLALIGLALFGGLIRLLVR